MSETTDFTLNWVKKELDETLNQARMALEDYVANPDDTAQLTFCVAHLHQVVGTLQIVQLAGAGRFAEEMEALAKALLDNEVGNREQAYDVLMGAILQLPDYLEHLMGGSKDVPVVLLPIMNDLRAARNASLISESSLFSPSLDAPLPSTAGGMTLDVPALRKLRHRYQTGLLAWFRDPSGQAGLERMGESVQNLENAGDGSYRLWWISAGLIEALANGSLAVGAAVKLLLGQVDRQIKRLIDADGSDDAAQVPDELLKNLLFYVAQAEPRGERVQAIKDAFALDSLLPSAEEVAQARESLSGRNTALMQTVAGAIKDDLARIRDTLDIYTRNDQRTLTDLEPIAESLQKIGDTLGVVGLDAARAMVQEQVGEMQNILAAGELPEDNRLMGVASALIYVESALDGVSAGGIMEGDQASGEYRQVLATVIQEAISDMARAKEMIIGYMSAREEFARLDGVSALFKQIKGGMQMLSMFEAAALLDAIGVFIQREIVVAQQVLEQDRLDLIADAISSIEFYLEGAQQDLKGHTGMLDAARRSVAALGCELGDATVTAPAQDADADAPDAEEAEYAAFYAEQGMREDAAEAGEEAAADPMPVEASTAPAPVAAPAPAKPAAAAPVEEVDDEILEIFIEEAGEEYTNISEQLPAWTDTLDNNDALISMRRSFHTLKGSGRLVGAMLIGELAWSCENMLNRVIDGTVAVTPSLTGLLEQVVGVLPALIENLRGAPLPQVDVNLLMAQAHALSKNDPMPTASEASTDSEAPAAAAPAVAESAGEETPVLDDAIAEDVVEAITLEEDCPVTAELVEEADTETDAIVAPADVIMDDGCMDPVLLEIFTKESAGHLDEVRRFIESCRQQGKDCRATEGLLRALHTLHGSAHMAGATGIAEVSAVLEKLVKDLMRDQAAVPVEGLELLSDCSNAFNAQLAMLHVPHAPLVDTSELRARIESLHAEHIAQREAAAPVDEFVEEPAAAVAADEAAPMMATATADADMEDEAVPADEVDPEILEIFLEESVENLEASDDILQRWLRDHDNLKLGAELQRELHTLKGGARMAGLSNIGNLAHGVESVLQAVAEKQISVSNRLFDVLHLAHDRLVGMIERARDNAAIAPATDLLQELSELQGAKRAAAADAKADNVVPVKAKGKKAKAGKAVETPIEPAVAEEEMPEADVVALHEDRRAMPRTAQEQVRVRADLLDNLVNYAGEVSIYRSRLEQQVSAFGFNLNELGSTVNRLREQLRKLEIETEAQILFRYESTGGDGYEDFDPLEMDRFSHMQQLSRSLMESVSDVTSLQNLFHNLSRESETLLLQQSRVVTELQEGLMRTRMVPFSGLAPRLRRIVRQTCQELNKRAELVMTGAEGEMDRTVIDRIVAPLEHMLRNAISHGIELPQARRGGGKHEVGKITVGLAREASDVVITVADDGAGIDHDAIRRLATERGLMVKGADVTDEDVLQFILESGFSTAKEITQISGRGVGMDVVNSEIKQLGGTLHIGSVRGKGTTFTIRLPFTLAINHALLVQVGEDTYAVPLSSVEGIVRLTREQLEDFYNNPDNRYDYAGYSYQIQHMGTLLGTAHPQLDQLGRKIPVLLVRSGEHRVGLQVEGLMGSREIVVKSVGAQISTVRGVSGATILGDGRVVLIMDVGALVRMGAARHLSFKLPTAPQEEVKEGITVMVVDDSITVRKVTTRLLERNGFKVMTAKDGVDAVALLHDHIPDIMLLDVEMPRMDGYELATHVRNEARLRHVPMIMITSRTGDKHRQRAMDIGVDKYLGKPFQESELLENIHKLVGQQVGHA